MVFYSSFFSAHFIKYFEFALRGQSWKLLLLLQVSCTGKDIGNLAIKSMWWMFVQVNSSISNTISLISMHVAVMAEQYFLCHFNVLWDSIWFFINVSDLPIKPFHNVIQRPLSKLNISDLPQSVQEKIHFAY